MKKFSAVILSGLLCSTALLFASCGDKTVDKSQMEEYIENKYYSDNPNEKIKSLVIDKRNTDKKEETDDIWCTVISNDGKCEYTRQFYLKARLYDASGWKLKEFEEYNKEKWETVPVSGVSIEEIKNAINYSYIQAGDYEWCITPDNLDDVTMKDQSTDLKMLKDDVTIDISMSTDIMKVKVPVKVKFVYEDQWRLETFEQAEAVEPEYKEGFKPDITDDIIIEALSQTPLKVGGTLDQQTVTITEEYVKDLKITEQKHSFEGHHNTVNCEFVLEKNEVVMNIISELNFELNFEEKEWEFKYLNYTPTITSFDLSGKWEGTYIASQGETNLTLDITQNNANKLDAVFEFFVDPKNNEKPDGSFKMSGNLYTDSFTFYLGAGEWIVKPEGYSTIDLYGVYMIDEGCLKQNSGWGFNLKKIG